MLVRWRGPKRGSIIRYHGEIIHHNLGCYCGLLKKLCEKPPSNPIIHSVVDFRLDTDPLLLRELPIGFGDGTGTQARPPLTPGNSAGLSVRNLTGEQATPPVVTAHRSSPAPSARGCMSSPGGRETRAGTLTHRSDGPRGLAAHTRAPRSRGGYRLAGDPG